MVKLSLTLLALSGAAHLLTAQSTPIQIAVDLSDAPRRLLHARLSIAVKPGPLTLLYPKWIPGEHSPSGPVENLAGITFQAGERPLPWRRDEVNMYAFHLEVPPATSRLDVHVDFLATPTTTGFSAGASTTANLCVLSWNTLLLYPEGADPASLQVQPSVKLPLDWHLGSALIGSSIDGSTTHFEPVSIATLVDSPVLTGRFFKEIPLAPEITPRHYLDVAADGPEDLNINSEDLTSFNNLIREAGRLFASHHYASYHFLLTLSDHVAHFGLEHHASSDDRVDARTYLDDDLRYQAAELLPHEFTHSWNGKYRRPAGLATGNYSTPMRGELLWVYEGLTQYLGDVLATRSGLWTPAQYRAYLADSAATLDARPGRIWRDLSDTAVSAQILYDTPESWDNWRRSVDYYPEGELIWLEVDTTIRRLSSGRKSLDDFCRSFFGNGSDTRARVLPYRLSDIVDALNAVQPYSWSQFLQERVSTLTPHAPLGGITEGGYRLEYNAEPNDFIRAEDSSRHGQNAWFSLGLRTSSDAISDVLIDSPAFKAGLGPGMKLIAVNGRSYADELLRTAISESKNNSIELITENTGFYKTVKIDYHDGLRYPRLVRSERAKDLLGDILKPVATARTARSAAN